MRRAGRYLAIALGVYAFLCLVSAALVGPPTWRAAQDGRTALTEGASAVSRRDAPAARVEFAEAEELFASAGARLRSPLAWPLRAIPLLSTHVGVGSALSDVGSEIASSGIQIADTMRTLPDESLMFRDGAVDLEEVRRASAALEDAAKRSDRIGTALAGMPDGWVASGLAGPRAQARELLPPILDGVRKARAALQGLPSILAEGGTKRYLVAFSNLSELRGAGGLFGYVTELRASDGDLDLEELSGRPTDIFPPPGEVGLEYPDWFPDDLRQQAEIFQNINMTSDFPTVGRFVVQTAERAAGPMDGVIAVDPIGIAAVLGLVGPVELETWPRPITAENVAEIAMHDVYVEIEQNDRRELFFEQLVRAAFDKLTSTDVRLSVATAGTFDAAVRGGHFRMYSDHDADQDTFVELGAAGGVARADGATDVLSVVSENAAGNKIDWFLKRDIRYRAVLDPDDQSATGSLAVTFRNTAPSAGLPDYVIGSKIGLPAGTNRQIVNVIRAPTDDLRALAVDGGEAAVSVAAEGALRAYRTNVDVAPRDRSQLTVQTVFQNAVVATPGNGDAMIYRLHVLRQPLATPDFVDIEVAAADGWRVTGQTSYLGELTQDVVLEVRLERTVVGRPWGWITHRVRSLFT